MNTIDKVRNIRISDYNYPLPRRSPRFASKVTVLPSTSISWVSGPCFQRLLLPTRQSQVQDWVVWKMS